MVTPSALRPVSLNRSPEAWGAVVMIDEPRILPVRRLLQALAKDGFTCRRRKDTMAAFTAPWLR